MRERGSDLLSAIMHEVQVCNRLPKCIVCGHIFGPPDTKVSFGQGALGGEQTFSVLMWALRCPACDEEEASQKMVKIIAEHLAGAGIRWQRDRN